MITRCAELSSFNLLKSNDVSLFTGMIHKVAAEYKNHQNSHLCPSSTTRTSQRGHFLNTTLNSLGFVTDSYVVTRIWYLAPVVPGVITGCTSSYCLMMSRDFCSPSKGTTRSFGAHRANSRTQLVIVELGTTTKHGNAFILD